MGVDEPLKVWLTQGVLGAVAVIELLALIVVVPALFKRLETAAAEMKAERERHYKEINDFRDRYDAKAEKDREKHLEVNAELMNIARRIRGARKEE